jgi:tetratricopeptide (TPR) repeat protein
LVVGVIGMIIGGEFLLSSRDDLKRQADNQRRARQSAAAATPAEPPAVPATAATDAPSAGPPTATPSVMPTPPVTPQPPVVPVQRVVQAPRPAARTADRVSPPPPTPAPVRPDQGALPAGMTRRVGESQSDFLMRAQRLQGTYDEARAALQAKDFAGAVALFERLEAEQSGFLDVPLRLAESRGGLRESKRAAARAAIVIAGAAEGRGDLVEAQKEYERALEADPACGADEALRRVRGQMKTLGDAAFKRARTFDAMSRTEDAIAQYERAVQLLPQDDPNRKVARARLDVLRASLIKQPSR